MKEINLHIKAINNGFQIIVFGDWHIGDRDCDIELIKETIEYIKRTPNCYAILNGDLINNALKTSKSDSYREVVPMDQQQDLVIELLKPIADRILVITPGNHEWRTSLLAGVDPTKYIAMGLGIANKYSDNTYLLNIEFGKAHGMKSQYNKYLVFGMHGSSSNGSTIGSTANTLENMSNVVGNADLYIHSHTHKTIHFPDSIYLYDTKIGRLKLMERTYYNSNSFLFYGGYAETKGMRPFSRFPKVITVKAIRKNGEMIKKTDVVNI